MKNFFVKYPAIKKAVENEIGKMFPVEKYHVLGYEPATIVSDRKNIFKAEVFFRRTEHEAHLCISADYSGKTIPVYWNELEFVEEGFKKSTIIPLGISLTGEQIREYFPVWSETPHTVKEVI